MENSNLKQLALLDLSILNFSIMRRRPEKGGPLRADSAPRALAHLLRSDHAIELTANACIALCSSRNAVNISSARTMKRFP
jgi:hypothetical protein